MLYPQINHINKHKDSIDSFGGVNFSEKIQKGELHEALNMTNDSYPVLTPRKKRRFYESCGMPPNSNLLIRWVNGRLVKVYVFGDFFNVTANDDLIEDNIDGYVDKIVTMGSYVILFPVGWYFNSVDTEDRGYIAKNFSATSFSVTLVDSEFTAVSGVITQGNEPKNPANGTVWADTSSDSSVTYKKWDEAHGIWMPMTVYTRFSKIGIGKGLQDGDMANIEIETSGISGKNMALLAKINGRQLIFKPSNIPDTDDEIWIKAPILANGTIMYTKSISVKTEIPQMDFVIESQNRLWGCYRGEGEDGKVLNEIYASKLGDFRQWRCYAGLSTDSYTVSIGSEGQFTGAINFNGYPLFFKENCVHKVFGNYPAQYQVQTNYIDGVQNGSHESLAIVNGILYYKGIDAVYKYDGSQPYPISDKLFGHRYTFAKGCDCGDKYYISMTGDEWLSFGEGLGGDWKKHLFVYDTRNGMWQEESTWDSQYMNESRGINSLCSYRNVLYVSVNTSRYNQDIFTINDKTKSESEDDYGWHFVTSWFDYHLVTGYNIDYNLWQIKVRAYIPKDQSVTMWIEYDDSGKWEQKKVFKSHKYDTYELDILTRRCDHCRIKVEGNNDGVKIYSISSVYEEGSEH